MLVKWNDMVLGKYNNGKEFLVKNVVWELNGVIVLEFKIKLFRLWK